MRSGLSLIAMAAIGSLTVPALAQEDQQAAPAASPESQKAKLTPEEIEARRKEAAELAAKAETVTTKMSALAASGELNRNSEAMEIMKEMLTELQQINERLDRLEKDLGTLSDGQKKQGSAIDKLNQHKPDGYFQFQFRDSDQPGREQSSFNFRRIRVGYKHEIDPRFNVKFSFDLAAGDNQTSAELKDMVLTYQASKGRGIGTQIQAGQFLAPMGYELLRSSASREFPEYAVYNNLFFNSERIRGVQVLHGVDDNTFAFAGVSNALSVKDREQENLTPGTRGRLAGFAGIRRATKSYEAGVGFFAGERAAFTGGGGTSPQVKRQFFYVDGSLFNVLTDGLELRGEAMFGKDRIPSTTGNASKVANDMAAYQVQALYKLNPKNQIFARYVQFDSNLDTSGNLYTEKGIGYRYLMTPASMLTFTYEWMRDPALADPDYRVATLRWQLKF